VETQKEVEKQVLPEIEHMMTPDSEEKIKTYGINRIGADQEKKICETWSCRG